VAGSPGWDSNPEVGIYGSKEWNTIKIFLNDSGNFSNSTSLVGERFDIADIDGTNRIVFASKDMNNIGAGAWGGWDSIGFAEPETSIATHTYGSFGANMMAITENPYFYDIDGDSDLDIIFDGWSENDGSNNFSTQISTVEQNGSVQYWEYDEIPGNILCLPWLSEDIDSDGENDCYTSETWTKIENGSPTTSSNFGFNPDGFYDYDGDGDLDGFVIEFLPVNNDYLTWYINVTAFGDNCPNTPNADQADSDSDGIGDACDD
jgi:hypothetical protein